MIKALPWPRLIQAFMKKSFTHFACETKHVRSTQQNSLQKVIFFFQLQFLNVVNQAAPFYFFLLLCQHDMLAEKEESALPFPNLPLCVTLDIQCALLLKLSICENESQADDWFLVQSGFSSELQKKCTRLKLGLKGVSFHSHFILA